MRDIQRVLGRPRTFGGLAAALVTMTQSFGYRVLGPIGLALIYWLLVIAVTFPLRFVISAACAMAIAVTILAYALDIIFPSWGI